MQEDVWTVVTLCDSSTEDFKMSKYELEYYIVMNFVISMSFTFLISCLCISRASLQYGVFFFLVCFVCFSFCFHLWEFKPRGGQVFDW